MSNPFASFPGFGSGSSAGGGSASGSAFPTATTTTTAVKGTGFSIPTGSGTTGFSFPTTTAGGSAAGKTVSTTGFTFPSTTGSTTTAGTTGFTFPTTTAGGSAAGKTGSTTGFTFPSTTGSTTTAGKTGSTTGNGISWPTGSFGIGANAAGSQKDQIPNALQNKTIKMILDDFEKEISDQVEIFRKRANQIKRYDRSIYDCLDLLLHLNDQIQNIDNAQIELIKSAKQIKASQEEFLRELNKNNKATNETESSESKDEKKESKSSKTSFLLGKNNQRYLLYEKASNLGKELLKMSKELNDIKDQTDRVHGNFKKEERDVEKIKKIANCHLNAMRYVDKQADELEKRLDHLLDQLQNE